MDFFKELKRHWSIYVLGVPGLLFLVVFSYLPMFGHVLAFKDFRFSEGILGSPWCGFENFEFFFGGKDWLRVTFNTIYLNALFIIFGLGASVIVAIVISEISHTFYKRIAQSLIFLPYFVSWLVVSLMVYAFLNETNGLVNNLLTDMGFEKIGFFREPGIWPFILTLIYVWKVTGYYSIIFIAAILGISPDYYDSAKLDGASKWQQITKITLPLIKPTIIMLVLLSIGRIFYGDFGMVYGIIGDNGVLFETTDIIDTYAYRALRQLGDFGMSAAVCLYQSLMGLVTILVFNHIVKKKDENLSLF